MKAILVIDMPKSCAECTLRTSLEANYLYCVATLPRLKIDPMTAHIIKEHKCPLIPMPNKRVPDGSETDQIYGCYVGWNACLEVLEDSQNAEDSNE